MQQPYEKHLVSVIMPMHNSEKFVEDAIRSVMAQTYTNWELLVIDDVSTDNSCDVVQRLIAEDKRIRLLQCDKHNGMPSAPRNMGMRHARGRYIAFLDSDDMWLPEKLARQLPLFNESRVAIAYSDYEKVDERGTRSGRIVHAPLYSSYNRLLKGNVIGNLTGMYDRKKTDIINFMDIHHEDYALWLCILKKGYLATNAGCVTALYRVRKTSVSSSKLRILSWQWNIYRDVLHFSVIKSCYYYTHYAVRAFLKNLI